MSKKISKSQQVKEWVKNLSKRTKVVALIVVVFLLIIAVLIYLVDATSKKPDPVSDPDAGLTAEQKAKRDANVRQAQREGTIRDSAKEALNKGDLGRVTEIYKDAIDAESETAKKVQLYKDKSRVLYDAGRYEEAIAVAREGEAISDDKFLLADWLYQIYAHQRQYAKAAFYAKLAAEWVDSPMNKIGYDADFYNKEAQRMTKLAGQK